MRDLTEHCRKIGFEESLKIIFPALTTLASDDEQALRQALAEQIPPLATYLKSHGPDGYDHILSALIPILPKLLSDDVAEVRTLSSEAECSNLPSLPFPSPSPPL